ncbi:MAG: hypothetical protein R3292_00275 [Alcanivorax sp.]|nr:hypothetical protein [Alcanivorax sp.]
MVAPPGARLTTAMLLLTLSGCASLYTQSTDPYLEDIRDCSQRRPIPNLYSGTVFDLYCIPAENAGFFCLLDLPLSLTMDTLLVPYTLYRQIHDGPWYHPQDCRQRRAGDNHAQGTPIRSDAARSAAHSTAGKNDRC